MLLMFKVKNYTSFKEEIFLDMRSTIYKQHPSHVLKIDENFGLLKTIAIYGANASGKSNLISAMFLFEQYIFQQFISNTKNTNTDFENKKTEVKLEPFLLTDHVNDVSEFEIVFHRNGNLIQYGFECTSKEVINEWYYINDKKVFERKKTEISLGTKEYQKILKQYSKVPKERLYLSVLDYFLENKNKEIILKDFIDFFNNEYNVFFEIWFESSVKKVVGAVSLSNKLVNDKNFRLKVEQYLKKIDIGIKGLDIKLKTVIDENDGKEKRKKVVKTIHDIYDENGNIVGEKHFDLFQESTGTLRFLAYIQNIVELTENGGVFIVDELSARLHPLLTKLIIDIFQSSENKKAQLIFTTHDVSLLNKEQFRRDEVVFVDKNYQGESKVYALSDRKIREDATFNKDYLQGKYGAIPIFKYDDILGGEKDGKN
ncbi:ATP-binding protein [Herbivorax sp. ANBcel31]|uniref:AAA family ATPase n=1 Tax=Herbivorax sp. ANBcel31 TaxID=3069754 RepID=UPI0027B56AFC|nr:ATP-binding protein [Herbivorax sp. ANBcel31]MDQ2085218.1 ATP-binding protein [Herbivorax sp. ANBcel31]